LAEKEKELAMKKICILLMSFLFIASGLLLGKADRVAYAQESKYKTTITVKITEGTENSETKPLEDNDETERSTDSGERLPQTGEKSTATFYQFGWVLLGLVGTLLLWRKKFPLRDNSN
jgi:LPXTG-motif cell wall-anchored protein